MKIGILTHHQVNNEGAVLQAYATQQILKSILPKDVEIEVIDWWVETYPKPKYGKRKKLFASFRANHLNLSPTRIISNNLQDVWDAYVANDTYDAYIVGSDEVWKIQDGRYTKPIPNIYYSIGYSEKPAIAMSASANLLDYNNISESAFNYMKVALSGFKFLGVRDNHTLSMVDYLDIKDAWLGKMCDPALFYDFKEEMILYTNTKKKLKAKGIDITRPILGIRIPRKQEHLIADDVRYFKKHGYQVVSFMHKSNLADFYLGDVLTPFEWIDCFKYLDFVITNSYHTMIFSLKNNIPIKVVDYRIEYNYLLSKTRDLANSLGISGIFDKDVKKVLEYYEDKKYLIPNSIEITQYNYKISLNIIKDILMDRYLLLK
jgi:hypothetical protein